MAWAGDGISLAVNQQAHVVERAEALQRGQAQEIPIATDRFGEVGFEVPTVGNDYVVGGEQVDRLAEPALDLRSVPGRRVKAERLRGDCEWQSHAADSPSVVLRVKVPHVVARAMQEFSSFRRVNRASPGGGPIEE